MTSKQQEQKSKQRKIRNSEYYDMISTFDGLYADSKKDKIFNHLMEIIESEENIKLAYRTIKTNTGSDTAGVDKRTINDLAKLSEEEYVRLIRKQFSCYHPRPVKRVEIPKPNGKTRPLGIPTIVDRVVQQCILQVMEPICEAKFSDNSYGFRPNRSAEHAIAQCMRLIQVQHMYHVVDLDIKGFFDNINHTKLIRQIWALGIRDKKLLCIIKEMLKAPVILPNGDKIFPTKGTPQGGILSPLLANIVLNELDWWITSQWEEMPTKTDFTTRSNKQGTVIKTDFLGFKLKVRKKGKKYVVRSHMCDKAYKKAHEKLTEEVKTLAHSSDDTAQFMQLQKYNSVVAGLHEYYCIATETTADFGRLAFSINKQLKNRLKGDVSRKGSLKNGFIKDKYGKSRQLRFLHERPIVPVGAVPQKNAQNKRKVINKYTAKGRELIHKNLTINTDAMLWLMRNPVKGRSIEYADNRISLFAAQYGKCAVTGLPMEVHDIHCHHKMPSSEGGTDAYENLILISKAVHVIIHATSEITIREYLNPLQLDDSKLAKLNKLRTMAEMPVIIL